MGRSPSATSIGCQFNVGDWTEWPWSLMPNLPAATRAAFDIPTTIIWHFQLGNAGPPTG
jgi:hypothetical protein